MAGELNKKQIAAAKKDASTAIDMYKSNAREQLREFRGISSLVATAHRAYCDAGLQNERKPSAKNEKKLERAYESLIYATDTYKKSHSKLLNIQQLIEREYAKLIELCRMQGNLKGAEHAGAEYEEYRESFNRQIEKNDKSEGHAQTFSIEEINPEFEPARQLSTLPSENTNPIEPPLNELPAPEPLTPKSVTPTVTSVNVAPVTIDVTPIVERAISSAIDKLSEGLNRKLEAYISNLIIPTAIQAESAANVPDRDALEGILTEECNILEKLKSLCASLSGLIVELGEVSSEFMTISQKQKELAELQKQINDIQRHTVREQQGVQVNQRLVSEEQVELIAAQALVAESQKELAERQIAVKEAQTAAAEAMGDIAEAMNTVAESNSQILEKQKQLIIAAEKQNAALDKLTEQGQGLLAEQKTLLSASKKLIKDQRQLAQKSAGAKIEKKAQTKSSRDKEELTVSESAELKLKKPDSEITKDLTSLELEN